MKKRRQQQARPREFKVTAVQRMLAGEPVSRLSRELKVRRSLLYRWRQTYREQGALGLLPIGRPRRTEVPGMRANEGRQAQTRIEELERKIGRQELELDFFRRAFKRVEALRRSNSRTGATASTRRSGR